MNDDEFFYALGRRIARLRTQHGFSQERLAAECGLNRVAIAYIETGKRRPTIASLLKIARALDTTIADIFRGL